MPVSAVRKCSGLVHYPFYSDGAGRLVRKSIPFRRGAFWTATREMKAALIAVLHPYVVIWRVSTNQVNGTGFDRNVTGIALNQPKLVPSLRDVRRLGNLSAAVNFAGNLDLRGFAIFIDHPFNWQRRPVVAKIRGGRERADANFATDLRGLTGLFSKAVY